MMLSATAAWGGAKGRSSQGAGRQPVANRSPRKETHLLHMSMLPLNPSKGFPGSTLCPLAVRLWCRDPVCFHGIEVIILAVLSCHAFDPNTLFEVVWRTANAAVRCESAHQKRNGGRCCEEPLGSPLGHTCEPPIEPSSLTHCCLCVKRQWHCGLAVARNTGKPVATNLIKSPWRE